MYSKCFSKLGDSDLEFQAACQVFDLGIAEHKKGILIIRYAGMKLLNGLRRNKIYSLVIKKNFEPHIFVGSSLLDMYAKAGRIHEARGVFDRLSERDVVSCIGIIGGYAQLDLDEDALELFIQLQKEGMESNCWRKMLLWRLLVKILQKVPSFLLLCGISISEVLFKKINVRLFLMVMKLRPLKSRNSDVVRSGAHKE
ncbi:hypothetical protein NE237_000379 [Protea cynaroides]|uniref:Pentatricopeptide repeat-containing protein n=1 Tax=Protea cynaroides TaxID=273540 RepID=A0A9Q0KR15_9MAGN|nr:hypothetical protein NE237_000379 [Protea cynaroides]